jgi:DNA polymerase-3 subunit delta
MPGSNSKPLPEAQIYILQGDDTLSIETCLNALVEKIDSGPFSGMNAVRLNGEGLKRKDLNSQLNTLPLGGSSRLVILSNAIESFKDKADREWFADFIKRMPASTVLALVIPDEKKFNPKTKKMDWQAAGEKHWLRKALAECEKPVEWLENLLPSQKDMPDWIMREARQQGASMDGHAAAELANLVGTDLLQARQEIAKALAYCGSGTPITSEVVRLLGSQLREENIFDLTDALGQRNAGKALGLLHALEENQPVQFIFSMLARQVRQLIMAREMVDEGYKTEDEIARGLGVANFVARNLLNQCRQFSMAELEALYARLDDMDESSKTGETSLVTALDLMIAEQALVSGKYS